MSDTSYRWRSREEAVDLARRPEDVAAPAPADGAPPPVRASGRLGRGVVQLRAAVRERLDPAETTRRAEAGVAGDGGPLPHLQALQEAFGDHDLSGVQALVGGRAGAAASDIGASAYATGEKIAFQAPPDLRTAAHEAAHVVQQRSGVSLPGGVGTEGDAYERQADLVADAVVAGRAAHPILGEAASSSSGGSVQRAVQKDPDREQPRLMDPQVLSVERGSAGDYVLRFNMGLTLGAARSYLWPSGQGPDLFAFRPDESDPWMSASPAGDWRQARYQRFLYAYSPSTAIGMQESVLQRVRASLPTVEQALDIPTHVPADVAARIVEAVRSRTPIHGAWRSESLPRGLYWVGTRGQAMEVQVLRLERPERYEDRRAREAAITVNQDLTYFVEHDGMRISEAKARVERIHQAILVTLLAGFIDALSNVQTPGPEGVIPLGNSALGSEQPAPHQLVPAP